MNWNFQSCRSLISLIVAELCDPLAPPASLTACKVKLETEVFLNIAILVRTIKSGGSIATIPKVGGGSPHLKLNANASWLNAVPE